MGKARYAIKQLSEAHFALYEDGTLLARFSRKSFRQDLEHLGRGNGWVGSILRLFNGTYPFSSRPSEKLTPLTLIIRTIGDKGIAEYLRQKGHIVYKPVAVSDEELINYIESIGYTVKARDCQTLSLKSHALENNSGLGSAHSGADLLCAVGETKDFEGMP